MRRRGGEEGKGGTGEGGTEGQVVYGLSNKSLSS